MSDHDQNLKTLLTEFIQQFFELFFPLWAAKFDFSSLEWLQQELFPDPPDGERRAVDLLAKLRTREPIVFDGQCSDQWLTLLHVEIEGNDSVALTGRRAHRYYTGLRDRHELPVLPIVLFLHVGLQGIGVGTYREDYGFSTDPDAPVSLDVLRFRYLYVALRGLDAIEYLQRGSELGVALASLMRIPEEQRVWFKVEALQRIASGSQSNRLRELLARFVELYVSLESEQEPEFDRLLSETQYEEAHAMGTTFFERGIERGLERGIERGIEQGLERGIEQGLERGIEQGLERGIEQGICRALIMVVEQRFGELTNEQKQRLAEFSNEQREELVRLVLTAQSLHELGLAD